MPPSTATPEPRLAEMTLRAELPAAPMFTLLPSVVMPSRYARAERRPFEIGASPAALVPT